MLQMIFTGLLCGGLLGFVMQRGRFCLTGGFRDMFIAKDNRMFYTLLIAIAVQSIGVYTLISLGLIQFTAGDFPWIAVIIGSFIFGIGIGKILRGIKEIFATPFLVTGTTNQKQTIPKNTKKQ